MNAFFTKLVEHKDVVIKWGLIIVGSVAGLVVAAAALSKNDNPEETGDQPADTNSEMPAAE